MEIDNWEKETIERIRKMIEGKRKENKETEKWSDDYYHALDDLLNDLSDNNKS